MTNIDDQAAAAYAISKSNGFWDDEVTVHFLLSKIALLQSEGSELLEAIRKEQGEEAVLHEMADVYIRLIDMFQGMKASGWLSCDASLDEAIANKMAINAGRPRKHGNLA